MNHGMSALFYTQQPHPGKEPLLAQMRTEAFGYNHFLYAFSHFKGFLHGGSILYFALLVDTGAIDDAHLLRPFNAVGIAAEAGQRGFHRGLFFICGSHNIIEFFLFDFQPAGNTAVNHRLELCIDGIEVDGACLDQQPVLSEKLQPQSG